MIFFPPIILLKSASLGGDLAIPHLQFFGFGVGTCGVSGVARKFIYNYNILFIIPKLFVCQSVSPFYRVSLKSDFTFFYHFLGQTKFIQNAEKKFLCDRWQL